MSGHQRDITGNRIGAGAILNQGDITGNVAYNIQLPNPQPEPERLAVCLIPYPQNSGVIIRPGLAAEFHSVLDRDHRCAALWGLGGSGKTQIALEYAYSRYERQGPDACAVFWVHADSSATFTNGYKEIAAELGVNVSLPVQDLMPAVRRAIQAQPAWVLVIDNADDLGLFGLAASGYEDAGDAAETGERANLQEYLPRGVNGTVIWTSRDRRIVEVVGPDQAIEVLVMTAPEATDLLETGLRAAPRHGIRIEDAKGEYGQRLLEELDWLPLAVSQAAVYMRRTGTSISRYLGLLQEQQKRWNILALSQPDRHRPSRLPNSVFKTWGITVGRIRRESPVSWRILHVVAYLDNQAIPLSILSAASGLEARQEIEIMEAVTRLQDFSFLNPLRMNGDEPIYEMHKLVQDATHYGLHISRPDSVSTGDGTYDPTAAASFAGIALEVMVKLFPYPRPENWSRCDELLAHALSVEKWAHVDQRMTETADLLNKVSWFLEGRGRYHENQAVAERILNLHRQVLGSRHIRIIRQMERLAMTFRRLHLHDKALDMYRAMLDLQKDLLGEAHPYTVRTMTEPAIVHSHRKNYREAESMANDALSMQRRVLGADHPVTLGTMLLLALIFRGQKQYDQAKDMLSQTIALQRKTFGETASVTLRSMSHLASLHFDEKRYDEAEEKISEVINIETAELGADHAETLHSMMDLARVYEVQGRHTEAEEKYRHVYHRQVEKLGDTDPDTLMTMFFLATTLHSMRRHADACSLMHSCLLLRKRVLGPEHPLVLETEGWLECLGCADTPCGI